MRIGVGLAALLATSAGLALAALHLAGVSGASPARAAGACGGDRWYIRTLQDRPRLLPVQRMTVHELIRLPRPRSLSSSRRPSEHRLISVVASPGHFSIEKNGDLRFALIQRGGHMAAAVPHPLCNSRATQYRRRQMGIARQKLIGRARGGNGGCAGATTITGVIFFTTRPPDGYRSAASGIELRPVLGVTCPKQ